MKNLLLATTALVATAGFAAADVSLSGRATLGAIKIGNGDFFLESDIDLYITGTTETDSGITLSATVEMEDLGGTNGGFGGFAKAGNGNATTTIVSVSGGFGTLTFGNTDGALDKNLTESYRLPGLDYELWGGNAFIDNWDNQEIARYDFSTNGFNVSLSYAAADEAYGLGVSWKGDLGAAKVHAGLAYEDGNLGDILGLSVGADFGAIGVRAGYVDGDESGERWNLGAQYSANGLSIGATYMENKTINTDGYNVYVRYDLGGGAHAFAQYGDRNGLDITSFGVNFSF